jgi:hypothetical protein
MRRTRVHESSGPPGLDAPRTRPGRVLALLAALLVGACGGDGSPTAAGNGTISASMNGSAWSVSPAMAQHNAGAGLVVIFAPSTGSYGLGINLPGFQGTGSYALGPASQTFAVVTVGADPAGWGTVYGEGSGTVTVTSSTSSRITGTFSFVAHPSPSSSQTGPMVVTNGQCDLPVVPVGGS